MVTIDNDHWYTLQEAANALHISYQAMQKWVYRRPLFHKRYIANRVILVRLEDVAEHQKRK